MEVPVSMSTVLLVLTLAGSALATSNDNGCQFDIVESMPDGLEFNTTIPMDVVATGDTLVEMIKNAKNHIKLASFYVYLTAEERFINDPTTKPGKDIMLELENAVNRGVKLDVILDKSTTNFVSMNNPADVKKLQTLGTVKFVNLKEIFNSGVMHSKFLIADDETFYLGSSNFDWRSYTQIKEIGVILKNCPKLAQDLAKVFETYQIVADAGGTLPGKFPMRVHTTYNLDNPLEMQLDDLDASVFMSAAPPAFNGVKEWTGRTSDIDGLLHIINSAEKFIDISVMNYCPTTYGLPGHKIYWPKIDEALRKAAVERQVNVRLLFSDWPWANNEQLAWYKSLDALRSHSFGRGGIHVRLFKVPADEKQQNIPYSRVKHDKYMVTDNGLFIGTSNWGADYFITTCGVSFVVKPKRDIDKTSMNVIVGMEKLFDRDFESSYARDL